MAKYVKQFRYYGEIDDDLLNRVTNNIDKVTDAELSSIHNYPYDICINTLSTNGQSLFRSCLPIKQLGIQTLPGTKFYLNFSPMTNPIIIGSTGRFELNLENSASVITDVYFDRASLEIINDNPNGFLIIDMVCEEA